MMAGVDGTARVELVSLRLAGDPSPWAALGFTVAGGAMRVGAVTLELEGGDEAAGITEWGLRGLRSTELDGLPTSLVTGPVEPPAAQPHANGAVGIDHVVVSTPRMERTLGALAAGGLQLRWRRQARTAQGELQQAFFRVGEVILEVVAAPGTPDGPARFWGLVFVVEDIDACAAAMAERLGSVRDAVQPGRRIVTVRREAGLGLPVALMSPDPRLRPVAT